MADLVYRGVVATFRGVFRALALRIELRGASACPRREGPSSRATT